MNIYEELFLQMIIKTFPDLLVYTIPNYSHIIYTYLKNNSKKYVLFCLVILYYHNKTKKHNMNIVRCRRRHNILGISRSNL